MRAGVPCEAPVRIAAYPADTRDTTGAGDAFCGAFMSRWLAAGPATDLVGAAEFAARIAAFPGAAGFHVGHHRGSDKANSAGRIREWFRRPGAFFSCAENSPAD